MAWRYGLWNGGMSYGMKVWAMEWRYELWNGSMGYDLEV